MPSSAPIIQRDPAPIIQRYQAPVIQSADQPGCDYACRSRLYQEAYMSQQCAISGNRYYYCAGKPLNAQQVDAINQQSEVMRGQYGYYRNGIYHSNP